MRAKLIKEENYEDFGFSADEAKKFKQTENPFHKLEQMVRNFMSEDKIYFDDMVRSFDKTKQEFVYNIICEYLRKTLNIDFQNIGEEYNEPIYKAKYRIYTLFLRRRNEE